VSYVMKLRQGLGVAAAMLICSGAQANFYFVDALAPVGTPSTGISSLNDFRTQLQGAGVNSMYLGRALGANDVAGGDWISVDFFAAEAGYRNQFWGGGSLLVDNLGNQGWSARSAGGFSATSGTLNFGFCAVTINACLANSANDTSRLGAAQSIGMWISADGNTAWLLWDDSGANVDDNHDDLIVRLTYRSVPEPGTLALLGLGLVGVALVRRRKAVQA